MPTLHIDSWAPNTLSGTSARKLPSPRSERRLSLQIIDMAAISGCRSPSPTSGELGDTRPSRRIPDNGRTPPVTVRFMTRRGNFAGSAFFGPDKTPQWEAGWRRPSFRATVSVSPNLVAAGRKPPPSTRRATRAGLPRCCNRSSAGLEKALPNARPRQRAAIEQRITSLAVSWPVPRPNPFCSRWLFRRRQPQQDRAAAQLAPHRGAGCGALWPDRA